MNKKICLILVTILAAVIMSGCNLKEKISENISEEIISDERISDRITGNTVDLTAADSGSEYEWPVDQAASKLPKLDSGTITYVRNGADTCLLMVEGISQDEYRTYKEAIIAAGFTKDVLDSSAENIELYSGTSSEECLATISFDNKEGSLQITIEGVTY